MFDIISENIRASRLPASSSSLNVFPPGRCTCNRTRTYRIPAVTRHRFRDTTLRSSLLHIVHRHRVGPAAARSLLGNLSFLRVVDSCPPAGEFGDFLLSLVFKVFFAGSLASSSATTCMASQVTTRDAPMDRLSLTMLPRGLRWIADSLHGCPTLR